MWSAISGTSSTGAYGLTSASLDAGAVVTKNIPPYCIAGGVPAKPIKFKWTIEQIMEHELALYPEKESHNYVHFELGRKNGEKGGIYRVGSIRKRFIEWKCLLKTYLMLSIVDAITYLHTNRNKLKLMSSAARNYIFEHFDSDSYIDKLNNIYSTC